MLFAEVEQVLAADPGCVLGHCLRAAFIVGADSATSRSALAESIAAIEAACPDISDPARRHAVAVCAWLNGDSAGAVALYDAILANEPHDVLALEAGRTGRLKFDDGPSEIAPVAEGQHSSIT